MTNVHCNSQQHLKPQGSDKMGTDDANTETEGQVVSNPQEHSPKNDRAPSPSEENKEENQLPEENQLSRLASHVQVTALESIHHVKRLSLQAKESVVIDRKSITATIFTVILLFLAFAMFVMCCIGGVALLFSPLWVPCLIISSPIWIPCLLFTSPIWLTVTLVVCGSCIIGTMLVFVTVLFFAWPEEWLPSDNPACQWGLRQRDAATVALFKFQTKMALYAAGVGPMADGLFLALDKIDIRAAAEFMREFDVQEFTKTVQNMSLPEMQQAVIGMLMGVFR